MLTSLFLSLFYLLLGDPIPSFGVKSFALADWNQKIVSIDVYEEIEEFTECPNPNPNPSPNRILDPNPTDANPPSSPSVIAIAQAREVSALSASLSPVKPIKGTLITPDPNPNRSPNANLNPNPNPSHSPDPTTIEDSNPILNPNPLPKRIVTYRYELIGTYDFTVPKAVFYGKNSEDYRRNSTNPNPNPNPMVDVLFKMSPEGALTFSIAPHNPNPNSKNSVTSNHPLSTNQNHDEYSNNSNNDNDNYSNYDNNDNNKNDNNDKDSHNKKNRLNNRKNNSNNNNGYYNNDNHNESERESEKDSAESSNKMINFLGFYLTLMFVLYVSVKILIQSPATRELIDSLTNSNTDPNPLFNSDSITNHYPNPNPNIELEF
jgi:hypothetical protein